MELLPSRVGDLPDGASAGYQRRLLSLDECGSPSIVSILRRRGQSRSWNGQYPVTMSFAVNGVINM
jgi:hypothetical protein